MDRANPVMFDLLTFAQIIFSYMILGGIYGLVSMGLALIWGVMNAVNMAHGDFLMIGMYVVFWTTTLLNVDPFLSIPIAVVVMLVLGGVVHRVAVEPLIEKEHLMVILSTLGVSMILESSALILWSPDPRSVRSIYGGTYLNIGPLRTSLAEILAFAMAAAMTFFLYRFLAKTRLGKQIRAVSQNPFGARALGIGVGKVRLATFLIGAVVAGMAGVFLSTFYPYICPYVGLQWSLYAFIIVILAGLEKISGIFVGGVLIGVSEGLGAMLFTSGYRHILVYLVFLSVLLIRPQGMFGKKVRRL